MASEKPGLATLKINLENAGCLFQSFYAVLGGICINNSMSVFVYVGNTQALLWTILKYRKRYFLLNVTYHSHDHLLKIQDNLTECRIHGTFKMKALKVTPTKMYQTNVFSVYVHLQLSLSCDSEFECTEFAQGVSAILC